jgi:Tfp pilus assembly protein PilX
MRKNEKGQALVLVLLSLSVVLTIVLFILSRTVTDISISSSQEASVRAFSAAEAGVEKALVTGLSNLSDSWEKAKYVATTTAYAANSKNFNYPIPLYAGDSMTTWFSAHDADGNLNCPSTNPPCFTGNTIKVCWGTPGTAASATTTPAIEGTVYYTKNPDAADNLPKLSKLTLVRFTADPNLGRTPSNSFTGASAGTCTIDGKEYAFNATISLLGLGVPNNVLSSANGGLQLMRVRMLYNSDTTQPIGVTVNFAGNSSLPSQGQSVDSSGTAESTNRRVVVFQAWPEFPFAGNALFVPPGITQ